MAETTIDPALAFTAQTQAWPPAPGIITTGRLTVSRVRPVLDNARARSKAALGTKVTSVSHVGLTW